MMESGSSENKPDSNADDHIGQCQQYAMYVKFVRQVYRHTVALSKLEMKMNDRATKNTENVDYA